MERGKPAGKSLIHTVQMGDVIAVSLFDLEAAAARCERVYGDPDQRWRAFRTMLETLRRGVQEIDRESDA